jgi:hypothetical protein
MNYNTFAADTEQQRPPFVESLPSNYSRYNYPTAIPPDPLQRYGSGHLDQDIFGISVSRLTIPQQMGKLLAFWPLYISLILIQSKSLC